MLKYQKQLILQQISWIWNLELKFFGNFIRSQIKTDIKNGNFFKQEKPLLQYWLCPMLSSFLRAAPTSMEKNNMQEFVKHYTFDI